MLGGFQGKPVNDKAPQPSTAPLGKPIEDKKQLTEKLSDALDALLHGGFQPLRFVQLPADQCL